MLEAIAVGRERQLFLDGHIIEWMDKVNRRVCPLEKHPGNPLIRPESPSEPPGYVTYGSVIYDAEEKLYKAWCTAIGEPRVAVSGASIRGGCYYFTSEDGVEWERPRLDQFLLNGEPTNIVALGWHAAHPRRWAAMYEVFGVSKDVFETDPGRRYKMGYLYLVRDYRGPDADPNHPGQKRGLGVAFSADGVRWTTSDEPVTRATVDGGTYWFRHPSTGRFVLFGRGRHYDPQVLARYGESKFFQEHNSGRAVNRAESEDFVHWEPERGQFVMAADVLDGPGDEIYSLAVLPYEGVFIGFVQVFHNYPDRVHLDIQLAVSRDSVRFERLTDRSAFIPVGEVGAWDRFNNSLSNGPPICKDDRLWFYYSGRNYLHSGAYRGPDDGGKARLPFIAGIGAGSICRDRFAALEASFDTGVVRTKVLRLKGETLHVNADTRFGLLEVRLLNVAGEPISGLQAQVQGVDEVDIPVPIAGLGRYAGQMVRLEFALQNSRLFSFWSI